MTSTKTIETKNTQIAQLESEIDSRTTDIQNLTEAIATLESGQPRPQNPKSDDAFELLKQLVGAAPENLEQQQVYRAKLQAARTSLKLAVEICDQKRAEIKALKDEMRSQQSDELVQQLLAKAGKFNSAIDEAFELLAQMKEINGKISRLRGGGSVLRTSSVDLNESPFCQISGETVSVRRRFDVKHDQRG